MNIGFDLDKVLIDYPPLIPSWLIDKLYKEKENGILVYRIPGKFEQFIRQLSHLSFLRKPIKRNMDVLLSLVAKNQHDLFLISSRFSFLKKQTEKLSKRHNFSNIFKQTFFNFSDQQPHIFKNKIIKDYKIQKYIDDDLSLIKHLAKNNPKTEFFWLNPKENKKIADNIMAVTRIDELVK